MLKIPSNLSTFSSWDQTVHNSAQSTQSIFSRAQKFTLSTLQILRESFNQLAPQSHMSGLDHNVRLLRNDVDPDPDTPDQVVPDLNPPDPDRGVPDGS